MNSMHAPRKVLEFDPVLLETVRACTLATVDAEDCGSDGDDWIADSGNNSELLVALAPLTEMILDDQKYEPWGIRYLVTTEDVEPRMTQNSSGWHVDGGKNYGSYLVADALPTEFLVRAPGLHGLSHALKQRLLQREVRRYPMRDPDVDIEAYGMEIYTPEALALTLMTDHIHRSPTNMTTTVIERTWIRASVMSDPE